MRWRTFAFLLFTPSALAQTVVSPDLLPRMLQDFASHPGEALLRCEITPLPPTLNFAFRFQAGYTFHVPQAQYPGATRGWSALTTITPQDGKRQPTVLLARHQFSDAAKSDLNFDIAGTYFLGVGHYSVDSALRDDRNRICRRQWQVTVQPSRLDRAVQSALPPYAVRQVSAPPSAETRHIDGAAPMRLSLLLNAAAFSSRRTAMRPLDRAVLLGSLTAMLEHLPATSVRMVVFSLEQQKEVFRSDNFSLAELNKVADAIRALQLATVDVHVLQNPLGHVGLLADLINRELRAAVPADTVVFLGPTSRYGNKIPDGIVQNFGAHPHFFYVRYEASRRGSFPTSVAGIPTAEIALPGGRAGGSPASTDASAPSVEIPSLPRAPPSGSTGAGGSIGPSGGASGPGTGGGGRGSGSGGSGRGSGLPPMPPPNEPATDIIAAAVARLKGRTLTIHTPAELAKAIRKIEGKR